MENETQQTQPAIAAQQQPAQDPQSTAVMYESLVAPALEQEPEIPFLAQYQPHSFWD